MLGKLTKMVISGKDQFENKNTILEMSLIGNYALKCVFHHGHI